MELTSTENINIELIKPLIKEFPLSDEHTAAFSYISIEEYPIHSHLHMELIYVMEGDLHIKVGVSDYVLHEGQFTIINPFELHALYAEEKSNKTCILEINEKFYNPAEEGTVFVSAYDLYKDAAGKDFAKILGTIERIFALYFTQIIKQPLNDPIFPIGTCDENAEYEKILLRSFINYIELHFTHEYFLLNSHRENTLRDNTIQANRLKTILLYFYEHYPQKIQLQDVADFTFVNRYHISHLVKSGIGLTFSELLQYIRIEKAEVYLLGTDMPINQIVFELGFSSYRYFSQHFKNLFHMTPTAYRKKYRHATIRYKDISYLTAFSLPDFQAAFDYVSKSDSKDSPDNSETVIHLPTVSELASDYFRSTKKKGDSPGVGDKLPAFIHTVFPAVSPLYDTPYFPALLLDSMKGGIKDFKKAFPCFFQEDSPSDFCFSGLPGHTAHTAGLGIKKAHFYLQELLAPFEKASAASFPGCFAVKADGNLHLLLYHLPEHIAMLSEEELADASILEKAEKAAGDPPMKWVFNSYTQNTNEPALRGPVLMEKRTLQMDLDAFSQWQRLGKPEELPEAVIRLLNRASLPEIWLEEVDFSAPGDPSFQITLEPFRVQLITLWLSSPRE